jgi:hypothetical protein
MRKIKDQARVAVWGRSEGARIHHSRVSKENAVVAASEIFKNWQKRRQGQRSTIFGILKEIRNRAKRPLSTPSFLPSFLPSFFRRSARIID